MATKNNQKIRDMVELLALTGKEMLPLAREGKNYKVTTKTLSEYIGSTGGGGSLPTDVAAQIKQNTENIEIIQNNITSLSNQLDNNKEEIDDLGQLVNVQKTDIQNNSNRLDSIEDNILDISGDIEGLKSLATTASSGLMSAQDKMDLNTLMVFYEGTDTDSTINSWKELEKFLEDFDTTKDLADLLTLKADKSFVVEINKRVTDLETSDFVDIDSLRSTLGSYYTKVEVDAIKSSLENGLIATQEEVRGYSAIISELQGTVKLKADQSSVDSLAEAIEAINEGISDLTTDDVYEGANKYFTNDRAIAALSDTLKGYVTTLAFQDYAVQIQQNSTNITNLNKTVDKINEEYVTWDNIPTKTSQLTNDSGFLTSQSLDGLLEDYAKKSGYSALKVLATDSSGNIVAHYVSTDKLGFLSNVTSDIQAQINAISIPSLDGYVTTETLTSSLSNLANTYLSFRGGGTVSGATTFSGGLSVQSSLTLLGVNVAAGSSGLTFDGKIPMYSGDAYTKSEADKEFHPLTTVDTAPTINSSNLVTSGGVAKAVADLAESADRLYQRKGSYLTASSSLSSAKLDKNTITIVSTPVTLGESITKNQLITNLGLKGLAFKDSIDLSGYLPLSGGTIKSTVEQALTLYRNESAGGIGIKFEGEKQNGWVGYMPSSYGVYLYTNNHYLYLTKDGVAKLDANTLIHSGNIGSYAVTSATLDDFPRLNGTSPSGASATGTWGINISGSANTLDGYHASDFVRNMWDSLLPTHVNCLGYGYGNNGWVDFGPAFTFGASTYYARIQKNHNTNTLFLGGYSSELGELGWREFAFTDSTVAAATRARYIETQMPYSDDWYVDRYRAYTRWGSDNSNILDWRTEGDYPVRVDIAKKLNTARTIWGQSFDGSGNVNGAIALLDNNSTLRNVVEYRGNNLHFGYDNALASVGYDTYINGKTIYLRYHGYATGFILNSSGNVTIGNSDLAGTNIKLRVNGSVAFGTGSNGGCDVYFTRNSTNYLHAGTSASDSNAGLAFTVGGNSSNIAFSLLSDKTAVFEGNVGIGTTDPSKKLDVRGNIGMLGEAMSLVGDTSGTDTNADSPKLWLGAFGYPSKEGGWHTGSYIQALGGYSYGNHSLSFFTKDSDDYTTAPVERMRITPSGNVGIGTTNPNAKLHVVGGAKITGGLTVGSSTDYIAYDGSSLTSYKGGSSVWSIDPSGNGSFASLTVGGNAVLTGGKISGSLTFSATSGSHIIGNSNSEIIFQPSNDTGSANIPLRIAKTGSSTFTMYCDESEVYDLGTSSYKWNILYCRSASQSSDATLKNILGNVALTTSQIANAPAVHFTWKNGGAKDVGTIAQYWKDVLPEVVSGEEGSYGMNYAVLGVVSSIILARNIETHEQRIARLEKEISDLQKELNALVNNE